METKKIKGYNDFELNCYIWDKVENPLGAVQIIHGLQEHGKRYDEFAKYLNTLGFVVLASDIRGHGITAMINNLPFGYSDGDIFLEIVQDQIKLTEYLSKKYKVPVSIVGHSFGSFIAQRYMVENGFKIKNIVLLGSTYTNSYEYRFGYRIAQIGRLFKGKKAPAKLIEKNFIKRYSKHFPNGNWLSRDETVWDNYNRDSLCGLPLPYNFYYSFLKNARKNYQNLKNIPYYLPILILSGLSDPVAGKNGLVKLFFTYGKARKRVFLKTFAYARHELLNEINKDEVYKDVSDFIKNSTLDYIPINPN